MVLEKESQRNDLAHGNARQAVLTKCPAKRAEAGDQIRVHWLVGDKVDNFHTGTVELRIAEIVQVPVLHLCPGRLGQVDPRGLKDRIGALGIDASGFAGIVPSGMSYIQICILYGIGFWFLMPSHANSPL
jgi:hypothetical protein